MSLESNGEFQGLFDLSPEEYYGCVYTINENRRLALKEDFASAPINPLTDVLIVNGSDGKSERHTQSKTEITLLTSQPTEAGAQPLADWYRKSKWSDMSAFFDVSPTGMPEVKVVGDPDAPLAYAYDDSKLVYPDRVLNSRLIVGNEDVLRDAKKQVLTEISSDGLTGKRMRKEIEGQLQIAMRGLETGEYRHKRIFTTDPPQQYYDEDPQNYSVGFKISGLRPVQRMTDLLTIRAIRAGKLSIDDASTFSTSTVDRIEALSERGLAPDVQSVIPAYQWFLQQYHVAQDRYKSTRGEVSVPFRADQFNQHRGAVIGFRESMKTFKVT